MASKKRNAGWKRAGPGLFLLAAALICAALSSSAIHFLTGETARDEVPPGALEGENVLFVTLDTLRADRLGSYGASSGLTPHLDRLAGEGVVFENVLAHVPLTLPSHASIFTGKYPTAHGVHDNGTFRFAEAHETLASRLGARGYRTAAFVGAFVLDARFGLDRGFDVYDDYYGEKRKFESFAALERRASDVLAPAERWLEGDPEEPWLAWVHLFDPHAPYEAPEPFRSRHQGDPYGAEIAYVDDALGRFFERLEAKGLLEDTLVVITSDHGESLGEHGELTHGTFAYNATLRVPWILWSKALPPGRFAPRVRHVDVLPTVLDLIGPAPPDGELDGVSLRPYLHRPQDYEPSDSYLEALNPYLTRDWAPLRGVVRGRYKLIDLPIRELYDLEDDPGEKRNLAATRPRQLAELGAALASITAATEGLEAGTVNRETVKRLASLGYAVAPRAAADRKPTYTRADDPKSLVEIANEHDRAAALFREGHTEEAVQLLRELQKRQPRSSFAHQKLAYALHQLGRTREAVRVLEEAVERGVADLSLLALFSSYLLEVGDVAKAQGLLESLVEDHPDFAEGHNYLGVAYGKLGRFPDARRQFERVLELDPSAASAHNNLGSLALAQGELDRAIEHFETALGLDPDLASAANGSGVAHARRGDMKEAMASWRLAFELSPDQYDALYNLAMALAEISPAEAIPYLERFAAEAPPERYRRDIANVRRLLNRWQEGAPVR